MKRKTTLLITCLLLVFINVVAQQKIRLTVLEKGTKQPLIGAEIVYADNQALNKPQYGITNAEGKSSLHMPAKGICHYRISYLGFLPLTGIIEKGKLSPTLYMETNTEEIGEVVVTGSHTARPVKLSPIQTQVISGRAMVDAGYGDIQKVLQQQTPGLNIQKVGFGSEMSMQGLDARHVMFLMDGERMTGDMAGNLDYERFNLHALDRIEIVKGATSTLYGSRASGAVINLITKKPTQPLSIDAGVRYAQMNERNYKIGRAHV